MYHPLTRYPIYPKKTFHTGEMLTVKPARDRVTVLDDPLIDEDALGAGPGLDQDRVVRAVDTI